MVLSMGLGINSRRQAGRVFSLIKAIACLYQHQREKDEHGAIIAIREDYEFAFKMANLIISEAAIKPSDLMVKAMKVIRTIGRPVQLDELADALGQKKGQVSTGVLKTLTGNGQVQWCDQNGVVPNDEADLQRIKHSGKAYVKEAPGADFDATPKLPTPNALFGERVTARQEDPLELSFEDIIE